MDLVVFLAPYIKFRPITSCWKILVEEELLNVVESRVKDSVQFFRRSK